VRLVTNCNQYVADYEGSVYHLDLYVVNGTP